MKKKKSLKPHKSGKSRWSLLPFKTLEEVVKAFMAGAEKYEDDNWMQNVMEHPRDYVDALMRHFAEYMDNVSKDKDSGLHPLAHLCANALILLWHEEAKKDIFFHDGRDLKIIKSDVDIYEVPWQEIAAKFKQKFHKYGNKKKTKKLDK